MGTLSKVKNVVSEGTYESKFGVEVEGKKILYKFNYIMEDGTQLSGSHKTDKGFAVGEDVEYEVKGSNSYGSYGSVGKPKEEGSNYSSGSNSGKGGYQKDPKTQMLILAQSTLAKSLEIFQTGALDENIEGIIKDGKTNKEDAICLALHNLTGKLMRSQIALADELSK